MKLEKIKKEYEDAIDNELLKFINSQIENYNPKKIYEIASPSDRQIARIMELLDIDVKDYKIVLDGGHLRHIINRHGENGKADKSMEDYKDLSRIKYILDNYDEMDYLLDQKGQKIKCMSYKNSDGSKPFQLLIMKKINGYYVLSEAIVETKNKRIYITTAFKTKRRRYSGAN